MLRSETATDPQRMQRVLAGLRAYQEAERTPPPAPMPLLAERHGAMLRDYGGKGPPILFVPSLINPPNVLDLSEERSLLRWMAARGQRTLLLDWGKDSVSRRDLSIAAHVEEIILPLIEGLEAAPALVGYCIGGTMAAAAAALIPVRSLATIAAPWHFSGFPDASRSRLFDLWAGAQPLVRSLGILPMEVLQSVFWNLDPGRTIGKFETFAEMDRASDKARTFVTLEDWANDGPPLPEAAARELFENFLHGDLPGRGQWCVAGRAIDPGRLECPQFHAISSSDRIVPRASAFPTGERLELEQGHVGMIVGSRAREALWEPLDAWLRHNG